MRELLHGMFEELEFINKQLKTIEDKIRNLSQQQFGYDNLMKVPGVGLITSSAFVARVGNAHQFKSARRMAAWLGIIPGHDASGTKIIMKKMTKRGDNYLRTLLIHCAR